MIRILDRVVSTQDRYMARHLNGKDTRTVGMLADSSEPHLACLLRSIVYSSMEV
jgi:hypothetical protein